MPQAVAAVTIGEVRATRALYLSDRTRRSIREKTYHGVVSLTRREYRVGWTSENTQSELSAEWIGHAAAVELLWLHFDKADALQLVDTVGFLYLEEILGCRDQDALTILRFALGEYSDDCSKGTYHEVFYRHQALLAGRPFPTEPAPGFGKPRLQANGKFPNYRAFWKRYYSLFGGFREGDLRNLDENGRELMKEFLNAWRNTAAYQDIIFQSLEYSRTI